MNETVNLTPLAREALDRIMVEVFDSTEGPHSAERQVLEIYGGLGNNAALIFRASPPALLPRETYLVRTPEGKNLARFRADALLKANTGQPKWAETRRALEQIVVCEVTNEQIVVVQSSCGFYGHAPEEHDAYHVG